MNKLFNAAETAALDFATAAPASTITFTADAKKPLLQRWFSYLRLRKAARLNADAAEGVDATLAEEKAWNPDQQQSAIYNLLAHHPHVIVAGLLSRKHR
jgi:hypothetical protein